jgi:hypothetical protein
MTSKTFGEALDRLKQISQLTDRTLQLQQLRQLVLEVSAAPPTGSIGVLWSGKFRPPGARFDGLDAFEVAKELKRLNPNFVLVNDTDVGRLLDSQQFEDAFLLPSAVTASSSIGFSEAPSSVCTRMGHSGRPHQISLSDR